MIQAENITVRQGGQHLLTQVDLQIAPGQHYGFLGPNGAGKSTLLNALSGDIPHHSGQIRWQGIPLTQWKSQHLAKMRAVLPQKTIFNLPFTGKEILEMGRYPHFNFFPTPTDQAILRFVQDLLDLGPFLHRNFSSLSGGEQQRFLLGKALAQLLEVPSLDHLEGKVLLLDEPMNNLDLYYQVFSLNLLETCQQNGMTILTVFHDLNMASRYCQQLVFMNSGKIIAHGAPDEVLTSQNLLETFRIYADVTQMGSHPHVLVPTLNLTPNGNTNPISFRSVQ